MTPLESNLRRLVAALDDTALAALASRGLLRRAQRDRERGIRIAIAGEQAGALHIQVDGFDVLLPAAGPALATCSCAAFGVCHHILAAVLHLQHAPGKVTTGAPPAPHDGSALPPAASEGKAPPSPSARARAACDRAPASLQIESALLAITPAALAAWAGQRAFQRGSRALAAGDCRIAREHALTVEFPASNVRCYFAPGAGLDGAIVQGAAADPAPWVVAAVVALQRAAGIEWPGEEPARTTLEEPGGAPRTRAEILSACARLHADLVRHGLAHVSPAIVERCSTLAVSALGVHLPRLALAVRALADECRLVLTRDARASPTRLLDRLGTTHALVHALGQPRVARRPDLIGRHRSEYTDVGSLELVAVAAWPWRTSSGYEGLTVLFWDCAGRRWNSWSESRPISQAKRFAAAARYHAPGPWTGVDSPRQLAHGHWRLQHARRNLLGRLSASATTHALRLGRPEVSSLMELAITDWARLEPIAKAGPVGLREGDPLDALVVLRPGSCGRREFDPIQQALRWPLLDPGGSAVLLTVRFSELTEPVIETIEGLPADSIPGAAWVGRIYRDGPTLAFEPYSLHRPDGTACHLALDRPKAAAARNDVPPGPEQHETDDGANPFEAEEAALTGALPQLLAEAEDLLVQLAERGGTTWPSPLLERLGRVAARARSFALPVLTSALSEASRGPANVDALLRAAYLLRLHRQALARFGS